jgi:N-acetyl-alpha-D-glucosaminyl L-malate synthase BshA
MRIGISCHTGSGGSGILATELGLRLATRGHEVHFIARESPFRLRHFVENVFFHPVETVNYPLFNEPPHSLSLASKMAEVVDSYNLDVLHAHYAIPHASSALLAKAMLLPRSVAVVTTLHGTDITLVGNQPIFQRLTRYAIDQSDRVTAVSRFLRDETLRTFETSKEVRVIHNFVDCERFRPDGPAGLRDRFAKDGEFVIMHASNFRPVKNIGVLLDVFDSIQQRVPARLVLIGEGPELSMAKRRIAELQIEDRVEFLGNQECIEELLPCADLFLLPSHHESFGLVALEAMACGVAVIGTSAGGMREVITDGVTGFLRHPTDISGWSDAAVEILQDRPRRDAMGKAARADAKERFCSDLILEQYEEEYERARDQASQPTTMRR